MLICYDRTQPAQSYGAGNGIKPRLCNQDNQHPITVPETVSNQGDVMCHNQNIYVGAVSK